MLNHITSHCDPQSFLAKRSFCIGALLATTLLLAHQALAQPQYTPPPPPPPPAQSQTAPSSQPAATLPAVQLDQLVARIALYPDPLLAQILPASTYWDQVPEAAEWANRHSYLKGDQLARAIHEDNLQWDPSILALLPFPSVLNMMRQDPAWTERLGNAVLTQNADVMDAIQRMRRQAYKYGFLRTSPYDTVIDAKGFIEIIPVNPAYLYVPMYDPLIVFAPPPPGFVIGGAIRFNPAIIIGVAFAPWGWTHPYFAWDAHLIYFDSTPWSRRWENRRFYVHPYEHGMVRERGPRVERHESRDKRR
jgi:hypothetical protein